MTLYSGLMWSLFFWEVERTGKLIIVTTVSSMILSQAFFNLMVIFFREVVRTRNLIILTNVSSMIMA